MVTSCRTKVAGLKPETWKGAIRVKHGNKISFVDLVDVVDVVDQYYTAAARFTPVLRPLTACALLDPGLVHTLAPVARARYIPDFSGSSWSRTSAFQHPLAQRHSCTSIDLTNHPSITSLKALTTHKHKQVFCT